MKSGDTISSLLGVGFLVCAGIILVRPGGALNLQFREWSEAASLRETVREHWTELSNSGRVLGSASGETRLVQFLDYQCGYCRDFHDSLQVALREHSEYSVTVRYKVSPQSRLSRQSALAALCAAQQGQFGQMHNHLLTNTEWTAAVDWEQVGREAGLRDVPNWLACLSSEKAEASLAVDSTWAARLSLRGTPALITKRDGVHLGIVPVSTLEEWWR
jgi:protein-disulfide isomerase